MGRKKRRILPQDVNRLRSRIERWRRTRHKRSPMPAELWKEAVSLARTHGVYQIASELRLGYESLRKRVAVAAEDGRDGPCGFVEVEGAQLVGAFESARTAVELSDSDGAKLVIRLSDREELNIVGLAEAFWIRGV